MIRRLAAPLLLSTALTLAACAAPEKSADASLYERLGGGPAIERIVDQFVANMTADKRINQRFADADIAKLKRNLADQICEASGGPCRYAGREMATAHKGMKISKAEFNWSGGHLADALESSQTPARERNELLAAIAATEPQTVGR